MLPKLCTIPECGRKFYAREWCIMHYNRWIRLGNTSLPTPTSLKDRFWAKVDKSGECWEWIGSKDSAGYGKISVYKTLTGAHRVSYELEVGAIPPGMMIDHVCHNPACVRPAHLRPVTNKQNMENRAGAQANNNSGYRGVYRHSKSNKWVSQVDHNGKGIYLGMFDSPEDAAAASTSKRIDLFTHNDLDRITA